NLRTFLFFKGSCEPFINLKLIKYLIKIVNYKFKNFDKINIDPSMRIEICFIEILGQFYKFKKIDSYIIRKQES
ncbi:MAG: hypothetical protein ACTSXH_15110, partial [Promethearchaeota archaeon]